MSMRSRRRSQRFNLMMISSIAALAAASRAGRNEEATNKVVPVPVPLSVPVLFGSESTVLFSSSVLFGSYIVVGTSGIKPI